MASYGSTFDKHAARTAFSYATHKNATQCLVFIFSRFPQPQNPLFWCPMPAPRPSEFTLCVVLQRVVCGGLPRYVWQSVI